MHRSRVACLCRWSGSKRGCSRRRGRRSIVVHRDERRRSDNLLRLLDDDARERDSVDAVHVRVHLGGLEEQLCLCVAELDVTRFARRELPRLGGLWWRRLRRDGGRWQCELVVHDNERRALKHARSEVSQMLLGTGDLRFRHFELCMKGERIGQRELAHVTPMPIVAMAGDVPSTRVRRRNDRAQKPLTRSSREDLSILSA